MKYLGQAAAHTWADYKTNTEIAKELNIIPVLHKIQEYIRNWLQHTKGRPVIDYREH
jgi:NADH:ubiquinone oxidoreductase subunit E